MCGSTILWRDHKRTAAAVDAKPCVSEKALFPTHYDAFNAEQGSAEKTDSMPSDWFEHKRGIERKKCIDRKRESSAKNASSERALNAQKRDMSRDP
jgi:hypothetical protein